MTWWQQYIVVPGIMTFLGICQAKKQSLGEDVVKVIIQIRDACIQIVGLPPAQ